MFARALQVDTAASPDRRCIITTISWVLSTIVIFSVASRLALKLVVRSTRMRVGLDDFFIGLATLLSLGQTITVTVASTHGLGQLPEYLTPGERRIYRKADYASTTLYIASMGCARLAVCLPMTKSLTKRTHKWIAVCLTMFVIVWMVSGAVTSVLSCSSTWVIMGQDTCTEAFANYIGSTNIVLELLLALFYAAWNMYPPSKHQDLVLFTTLIRFSVVAATSAQLYLVNNSTTSDTTHNKWAIVICIQIAQTLSIIACLPYVISTPPTDPHNANSDLEAPDSSQKLGSILRCLTPDLSKFSHHSTSSIESRKSALKEKISPPCHPLATHGLIRASPSLDSHTFRHHHLSPAIPPPPPPPPPPPLPCVAPPANVFNRLISVPHCRPGTASSDLDPLGIPRTLNDVGFLPAPDWDTDVEEVESRRGSGAGHASEEYVFNRHHVVSAAEERDVFDAGRECKRFVPPLPSPQVWRQPPRPF